MPIINHITVTKELLKLNKHHSFVFFGSQESIEEGDKIVICANCKKIHTSASWMGSSMRTEFTEKEACKNCNNKFTLAKFPKDLF